MNGNRKIWLIALIPVVFGFLAGYLFSGKRASDLPEDIKRFFRN